MWKRFTGLATVVTALLLVTAACASAPATEAAPVDDHAAEEAEHEESSSEVDRILEVELNEFDIAAESFAFAAGETVEFAITNSGVVEHEFRLSNTDRVEEHLEGGHDDHDDGAMTDDEMAAMPAEEHEEDEAAHDDGEADHADEAADAVDDGEADHADEAADAVLVLAPGESGTLVFTFPNNEHDYTAIVCLLPGHYEAGMATDMSF